MRFFSFLPHVLCMYSLRLSVLFSPSLLVLRSFLSLSLSLYFLLAGGLFADLSVGLISSGNSGCELLGQVIIWDQPNSRDSQQHQRSQKHYRFFFTSSYTLFSRIRTTRVEYYIRYWVPHYNYQYLMRLLEPYSPESCVKYCQ